MNERTERAALTTKDEKTWDEGPWTMDGREHTWSGERRATQYAIRGT